MKKILRLVCLFGTVLLPFSCAKQQAQLPSNKDNKVDSTNINLRAINEVLTQKEDSLIAELVKKQNTAYNKTSSGIWYEKEVETTLDSLKKQSTATFSYVSYTISGEKVNAERIQIHFEKKEVPVGLEEGLKLMRKGEKMRLIVPWYLAYGLKGENNIPPYTSLIYEITAE